MEQSTAETDSICEPRLNRQLNPAKPSQNCMDIASADEKATATTAFTPNQGSAPQEPQREVATVIMISVYRLSIVLH